MERSTENRLVRKEKPGFLAKADQLYNSHSTRGAIREIRGLPTDAELAEAESSGFDLETVQSYLDSLDRLAGVDAQLGAAMLRGAFNDLLDRIDNSRPEKVPVPAIPEAG